MFKKHTTLHKTLNLQKILKQKKERKKKKKIFLFLFLYASTNGITCPKGSLAKTMSTQVHLCKLVAHTSLPWLSANYLYNIVLITSDHCMHSVDYVIENSPSMCRVIDLLIGFGVRVDIVLCKCFNFFFTIIKRG